MKRIWLYYLKMMRYEQLLVAGIVLVIMAIVTLLLQGANRAEVARSFGEGALPLIAALMASGIVLNDPCRELIFAAYRPLWRTVLERIGLLLAIMTGYFGLFAGLMWLAGVPWPGWSGSWTGLLVWLAPGLAWLGFALLIATLSRSAAVGNGLTAFVWLFCFVLASVALDSRPLRAIYPLLTTFRPDSSDWPLNRLLLIGGGLLGTGTALLLLRSSERYLGDTP